MQAHTTPSPDGVPAPPTAGLVLLFTLAIGFVMAMIDVTAVNVALPDIAVSLTVPLTGLVWVVDGYTLTFAALLLVGGALADRFGPKNAYQAGLLIFIVASILCAVSNSGNALIASRLLQGVGAALFMPSSLSLLVHAFPDDKLRTRMLGLWSAMVGASSAIGPLVGGLLIHEAGWRAVFWVNVPLGVAGIVLAQLRLRATAPHERPLSLTSHALGVTVLSAFTYLLIEGPGLGWLSSSVIGALTLAIVAVYALVRRERNGSHPLLPPALVRTAGFLAVNLVGFFINFGVFGMLFFMGLYLQQARSADPLTAGLMLLPMMATVTVGNLISAPLSTKFSTRFSLNAGTAIATLACLALTQSSMLTPYPLLILGAAFVTLAAGTAIPAMTTTTMRLAGKPHANTAGATLNANRQIGALVGVAIVGTAFHSTADWNTRLLICFAAFTLTFAIAFLLAARSKST